MRKILNKKHFLYYLNDYEIRKVARYFLDENNILSIEHIYDMRLFIAAPETLTLGMIRFIENVVNCVDKGIIRLDAIYSYSDIEGFKEVVKYEI